MSQGCDGARGLDLDPGQGEQYSLGRQGESFSRTLRRCIFLQKRGQFERVEWNQCEMGRIESRRKASIGQFFGSDQRLSKLARGFWLALQM
jgi:hypothetical protein